MADKTIVFHEPVAEDIVEITLLYRCGQIEQVAVLARARTTPPDAAPDSAFTADLNRSVIPSEWLGDLEAPLAPAVALVRSQAGF